MARVQGMVEERWPRERYNVWIDGGGTKRHVVVRFRRGGLIEGVADLARRDGERRRAAQGEEMKKHGRYCFCTDCCESREESPEDFPDYDEWKKAFPDLPWDETTKEV